MLNVTQLVMVELDFVYKAFGRQNPSLNRYPQMRIKWGHEY